MNVDLEQTLAADAGMRTLVAALRNAPAARVDGDFAGRVLDAVRAERTRPFLSRVFSPRGRLLRAAAALVVLLGAGYAVLRTSASDGAASGLAARQQADGTFSASSAAPYVQAFAVTVLARDPSRNAAALDSAVGAIVREQNAEGGWANAAVSARNVVALRQAVDAGVAGAVRAYRRGRRYLRLNGIVETSAEDLVREAQAARGRLGASADRGLSDCLALCASL